MKKFFENNAVKYIFSAFSVLYLAFVAWLGWISYFYFFQYNSLKLLYVVYFLINIVFAIPIFLSRKTIITKIAILALLPMNLVLIVLSIETGNWMMFMSPLIVSIFNFFFLDFKYTAKAMLTTLTAVMYVLGIMGYVLYITLFGKFPFHNFSGSTRYDEVLSPSTQYRYVVYIKDYASTQKIDIYVEPTNHDINLGIVKLEHYYDNLRIYSSKSGIPKEIVWENDKVIDIDGEKKTVEFQQ